MRTDLFSASAARIAATRAIRRVFGLFHRADFDAAVPESMLLSGFSGHFSVSSVPSVVKTFFIAACMMLIATTAFADDAALWNKLAQGGQVVLIRHSPTVPGSYDPPGFTIEDCSSQRLLSDAGREHAKRLGAAFRERNIPVERVLSSRFCRCIDTAALAFGTVEPWEMLDNTGYDNAAARDEKREAVREAASRWGKLGNLILVTHGFNISAAVGTMPSQGEMVILEPLGDKGFRMVGRLTVR